MEALVATQHPSREEEALANRTELRYTINEVKRLLHRAEELIQSTRAIRWPDDKVNAERREAMRRRVALDIPCNSKCAEIRRER